LYLSSRVDLIVDTTTGWRHYLVTNQSHHFHFDFVPKKNLSQILMHSKQILQV